MPKKTGKQKKAKGKKKVKTGGPPRQNPIPVPKTLSSVGPKKNVVRMGHHSATCSMIDPFCPHARGAQRPDGGPPTIPFQIRGLVPDTADVNGRKILRFTPGIAFQSAGATYAAGPPATWTFGGTYSNTLVDTTSILTNAKEIRIVSFGIIFRSALSATDAKGIACVTTLTSIGPSDVIPVMSMSSAESSLHTLAAGTEISWVSKPMGPSAHLFKLYSGYTNNMNDFDWTGFQFEVTGTTASATYGSFEYVCNVEFTLGAATSGMANLAKPPPKPNRVAIAAADNHRTDTPSVIQGGIDAASKKLSSMASSALDSVLSDIWMLF
jgi:hypothetical protein